MFENKTRGNVLLKLGIILVLLAGIAFAVMNQFQATARVKAVSRDTAVDAVTGSVSVDAEGGANKDLKAEGDGKVVQCDAMVEARAFKEGDVLVQLDTTDLERQVKQHTRQYEDARQRGHLQLTGGKPELLANIKELSVEELTELLLKVNPDRQQAASRLTAAKRLHELNSISDEDLRTAERTLENIDLNLQLRALDEKKGELDYEAALENLKILIERMQIVAPSDGEIVESYIWKGALIARGQLVGKFMSHGRVVAAKISEEDFGKVKVGQTAYVRLLSYGEQNFDATVTKLLPKADEAQRFKVFLDVKVDRELLKPNSTGEVTITVAKRPNALVIPRRALFGGDKVWVVKNGRVQRRQVKIGFDSALNVVEILEGLSGDDHVIVDRLEEFYDGQRVRVEIVK